MIKRYIQEHGFLLAGIGSGLLFLVLEAGVHVAFFRERGLFAEVFEKDFHEIALRLLIVFLFITLGAYAQAALGRRKQQEQEIVRAGIEWKRTFDAVPDLVSIIDRQYRFVRTNKALSDRLGIKPEEVVGSFCYKVLHGLDNPPSYCPLAQVMEDGQERSTEIYEKRIGGDYFITLSPLREPDGTMSGCVHVARDISKRKRAERMLQESEGKFRSLAEQSLIGIYLAQDDAFRYVNPRLAEIFGYDVRELADERGPADLVHPEDWPVVERNLKKRLTGETSSIHYDFRGIKKNGEVISVEVYGSRTEYEGRPAVIGTLLDITERRQAEEALKTSEKKFREVTAAVDEGIYVLDAQGCVTFMNPAAEKLLGWAEAELLAKQVHDIIHRQKADGTPLTSNDCPMHGVIKTSAAYVSDCEVFIRKNGTTFPVSVRSGPIMEGGKAAASVTAFHDVSSRKRAEEEREQLVSQLREALANIKTLRGFIPICASCKKIRDDKGYWNQVEAYVSEHSLAEFSHGICPDCLKRLYPDYVNRKEEEQKE